MKAWISTGIIAAAITLTLFTTTWLPRLLQPQPSWQQLDSDSRFYFQPGLENAAKQGARIWPTIVDQIEGELSGPLFNRKSIRIYLLSDPATYEALVGESTKQSSARQGDDVYVLLPTNAKEHQIYQAIKLQLAYMHFQQRFSALAFKTTIPAWYADGLALHIADGGNEVAATDKDAITWLNTLKRLSPDNSGTLLYRKTAEDYGLDQKMYNAQTRLFVNYLQQRNPNAFRTVMVDLHRGKSFQELWLAHYRQSLLQLWLDFLDSVKG